LDGRRHRRVVDVGAKEKSVVGYFDMNAENQSKPEAPCCSKERPCSGSSPHCKARDAVHGGQWNAKDERERTRSRIKLSDGHFKSNGSLQ
jgi:hypothetical protein